MNILISDSPYIAVALAAVIIIVVAIIIAVIVRASFRKLKREVTAVSPRIRSLIKLNETVSFVEELPPELLLYEEVKHPSRLSNANPDTQIVMLIEDNYEYCNCIYEGLMQNRESWYEYCEGIDSLPEGLTEEAAKAHKWNYRRALKAERQLEEENTLAEPVLFTVIKYRMQYLSPSGQSDRFREWMIKDREFLVKYFQNRSELELMRLEHKRQRSLINSRLRYDVMKRDNFRCVLCGRGAADGVKLHVDHLLPIAKGGKTEPDNLRTLCADCNLGKSDRYDPDGLN